MAIISSVTFVSEAPAPPRDARAIMPRSNVRWFARRPQRSTNPVPPSPREQRMVRLSPLLSRRPPGASARQ